MGSCLSYFFKKINYNYYNYNYEYNDNESFQGSHASASYPHIKQHCPLTQNLRSSFTQNLRSPFTQNLHSPLAESFCTPLTQNDYHINNKIIPENTRII